MDRDLEGLSLSRADDLLVECGRGDEESIPYHLYTGTSLRKQSTLLVVRFATRTILIEGERLRPYRDAISRRRLERLQISTRTELIESQKDLSPVITKLRVYTPKEGEIQLQDELGSSTSVGHGPAGRAA